MFASPASWLPVLALAVCVSAQQNTFATPVNASYTAPSSSQHIVLQLLGRNGNINGAPVDLVALTPDATTVLTASPAASSGLQGTIRTLTAANPYPPTTSPASALISCDPQDYSGLIGIDNLVTNAIAANVSAIVFYSTRLDQCSLSSSFPSSFVYVYSITSARNAQSLLVSDVVTASGSSSVILTAVALQNGIQSSQASNGLPGGPSTAVAMIILYSITGVITALFLVIIITGAIRAHRHPERYGPRNIIGRARQSRAKGIARAMLETIPIVKFGDDTPVKDVELSGPSTAQQQAKPDTTATTDANNATATDHAKDAIPTPHDSATAVAANVPTEDDNKATCSICTEDFERGQDIRLLPCNHKFHPACVDPWLLDVSGTCPLCRVDLRPSERVEASPAIEGMPPPLDPLTDSAAGNNSTGGRLRGLLRRLQPSTPEERLAALRRFREENAHSEPPVEGTAPATEEEEEGHASRWERVRRRLR